MAAWPFIVPPNERLFRYEIHTQFSLFPIGFGVAHHFDEHDGTRELRPPISLLARQTCLVKGVDVLNRRLQRRWIG